jgi:hypothetical protein
MNGKWLGSQKILKGIDSIRHYISPDNPISRDKVLEFIKMGMNAKLIGSVWYAHADHIDNFFLKITSIKEIKHIHEIDKVFENTK